MLSSGAFSILGTEPVTLLILDPQNDFHTGTLGNSNASKDARRITELIRRNLDCIDNIVISMDSHQRNHIAHAVFWKSGEGFTDEHKETHIKKKLNPHLFQPKVFTSISTQDILDRIWVPVDQSLLNHCIEYTRQLAQYTDEARHFTLTIWPEHCLIGTSGHAVEAEIHTAIQEWSRRHLRPANYVFKGTNCLTEMYSAIKAEVQIHNDPQTQENVELLEGLRKSARGNGKLIVCGQAMSHTVNYTLRDIVDDWEKHNLNVGNIILLEDGASPVAKCEFMADVLLRDMRAKSVQVMNCADICLESSEMHRGISRTSLSNNNSAPIDDVPETEADSDSKMDPTKAGSDSTRRSDSDGGKDHVTTFGDEDSPGRGLGWTKGFSSGLP